MPNVPPAEATAQERFFRITRDICIKGNSRGGYAVLRGVRSEAMLHEWLTDEQYGMALFRGDLVPVPFPAGIASR